MKLVSTSTRSDQTGGGNDLNGLEKLVAIPGDLRGSNRMVFVIRYASFLRTNHPGMRFRGTHPPFALRCFHFRASSAPGGLPLLGDTLPKLASWADVLCRLFGRCASLGSSLAASTLRLGFGVSCKEVSGWQLLRAG